MTKKIKWEKKSNVPWIWQLYLHRHDICKKQKKKRCKTRSNEDHIEKINEKMNLLFVYLLPTGSDSQTIIILMGLFSCLLLATVFHCSLLCTNAVLFFTNFQSIWCWNKRQEINESNLSIDLFCCAKMMVLMYLDV